MSHKGYVAGFFDADGHAYINNANMAIIEVTNINKEVLSYLQSLYGGSVKPHKRGTTTGLIPKYSKNIKPRHRWRLFRKTQVRQFLKDIQPLTIVKQNQIQKCIDNLANKR